MKLPIAGLFFGASANLIWGLAFLVPVLLGDFSPIAITLGRYTVYGVLSVFLFAMGRDEVRALARREWPRALAFAVAGNIGYYFLLVQAIQLVGVPVSAMIIGTIPITVSLYGNIRQREYRTWLLTGPLTLIGVGIILVNSSQVTAPDAMNSDWLSRSAGIACAFGALALWTWYGVENARWMKANRHVDGGEWATVVGLATLACAALSVPLVDVFAPALLTKGWDNSPLTFVAGSVVLGLLVSWVATLLWNKASAELPVGITGQLIVIETVSGIAYFYVATRQVPSIPELAGGALLVSGVLLGIWLIVRAVPRSMRDAFPSS